MSKKICVSLHTIKLHELHTTLRHLQKHDEKWSDLYLRLGEIVADTTTKMTKSGSALVLFYLLLSSISDRYQMSVTFQGVTASVPTSFPLLVAAASFYFFVMQIQTFVMITVYRSRQSSKLQLRGFSANCFGFIMKQDDMALVTPVFQLGFLRDKYSISDILTIQTTLVVAALFIPTIGLYVFLFDKSISILLAPGISLLPWIIAYLSALILVFVLIFAIFFNIPLPMKRDSFSIRWGFLTRLHPLGMHPRVAEFLSESEGKNT
ncbi:hypothetical protein [Jannaschia sp. CCS1]|uniref:hypothetical protein n=1 Tax=Jannaschia sp. (strain CCS1) TaxID=290400 RepID=UPI000053D0D7|nr:hypothetical protein [Jannaschia sp. CCS1]ABD54841.1 hypothetical protein Jann_1924 [Jannaschia sp. CCS1]